MIFCLSTVYKKHDDDKIGGQTREKLQELSQIILLLIFARVAIKVNVLIVKHKYQIRGN